MEWLATGYNNSQTLNNTQKINANKIDNDKQAACYTEKINTDKKKFNNKQQPEQKEKIKISIYNKSKTKNLKFLINLYLKIILCISEINNSMLKTINHKQNYQKCIIQMLQKIAKIFKISFQYVKITVLTRLKRHKVEKVKIKNNLHIVRHFVGICLIRLISLKRLQQIPEKTLIIEENYKQRRIVGNVENLKCLKKEQRNGIIKTHLFSQTNTNEEDDKKLQFNSLNLLKSLHQIVGNSQICLYLNENFEKCYNVKEKLKFSHHNNLSHLENKQQHIVGNSQSQQYLTNVFKETSDSKCVIELVNLVPENKNLRKYGRHYLKQIAKGEFQIVGNSQNFQYINVKLNTKRNETEKYAWLKNENDKETPHNLRQDEIRSHQTVGNSQTHELLLLGSCKKIYNIKDNKASVKFYHCFYLNQDQIVGNSQNFQYINVKLATTRNETERNVWLNNENDKEKPHNLRQVVFKNPQIVGNSQKHELMLGNCRKICNIKDDKESVKLPQYFQLNQYQIVGNSQNFQYINDKRNKTQKYLRPQNENDKENQHHLCNVEIGNHRIVGNSQKYKLLLRSCGKKFNIENNDASVKLYHYYHFNENQVVGNSQNFQYINVKLATTRNETERSVWLNNENDKENQHHLYDVEIGNHRIVGNSQKHKLFLGSCGKICNIKYDEDNVKLPQYFQLNQYQVVGNSQNLQYINVKLNTKRYETKQNVWPIKENEKEKQTILRQVEIKNHQIVGNSQNYKPLLKNCRKIYNIKDYEDSVKLPQYFQLNQYQVVGNSQNLQYKNVKHSTKRNETKQNVWPIKKNEKEKQKILRQVEIGNHQIVGNSQNYKPLLRHCTKINNIKDDEDSVKLPKYFYYNEHQVVGNSQNFQHINVKLATKRNETKNCVWPKNENDKEKQNIVRLVEIENPQIVGNSQKHKLLPVSSIKIYNIEDDEDRVKFDQYFHFNEYQVVGNSLNFQYENFILATKRNETEKSVWSKYEKNKEKPHNLRQNEIGNYQTVGNSQNYIPLLRNCEIIENNNTIVKLSQYFHFNQYQVVGNSQNCQYVNAKIATNRSETEKNVWPTNENDKEKPHYLCTVEIGNQQIVGNSKTHNSLHESCRQIYNIVNDASVQFNHYFHLNQYHVVGNSQNFPHINDTLATKQNVRAKNVCHNVQNDKENANSLSPVVKRKYQIVGNSQNYKICHNVQSDKEKANNLSPIVKRKYLIVGNSQNHKIFNDSCGIKFYDLQRIKLNHYFQLKQYEIVGNSQNCQNKEEDNKRIYIEKNGNSQKHTLFKDNCGIICEVKDHHRNRRVIFNHYNHLNEHQIVGNSPDCVNKNEINNLFYNDNNDYKAHLIHTKKREYIVGNSKNIQYLNDNFYKELKAKDENVKVKFDYQFKENENKLVGNSMKCNYLRNNFKTNKNEKNEYNRKVEENLLVYIAHITQFEKKECQIVGNSRSYKYLFNNWRSNENYSQVLNHNDKERDRYHCVCYLKQFKKKMYHIVGNTQNIQYLIESFYENLNANKEEKAKLADENIEFLEVGNSQKWQYLQYKFRTVKESQTKQESFLYHNVKENCQLDYFYSHLFEYIKSQIVGNSQGIQFEKIKYQMVGNSPGTQNLYSYCKKFSYKKLHAPAKPVNYNYLKKVCCLIVGNSQSCHFVNDTSEINKIPRKILLSHYTKENDKLNNYHPNQICQLICQIISNSFNCQIYINDNVKHCHYVKENEKAHLDYYSHLSHNKFYQNLKHRQNQHLKQRAKNEFAEKFHHHFLFFNLFCNGSCWHIYGFPLVSRDIFKYLKDFTVRVLTWLKTSLADYNNVAFLCGRRRKLAGIAKTKTARKVKADIIANKRNFIKTQTHTTPTTKSATATTISPSLYSSATVSSSSSYSLSSSTSSQVTLPTTTPYCHYLQQQNHHHHHQYRHQYPSLSTSSSAAAASPSSAARQHLKLPSLLLLSRTFIILILLSSLWHTSEGFHGTGIKLSPNTVKTKYGLVRGIVVRSSPSLVEAYLGIPYASPPVGSLRFMPPITPSTWKNVRNSDRFSPVCPQTVPIPPNGPEALLEVPRARLAQLRRLLPLLSNQSEDCLYLNIYVPYENRRHRRFTTNSGELNDTPKIPTILFIHGESYEWNSGNPYDGSELAANGNVIVVTINFRLGIFGFLKTGGKESAQGNFGLMDLVAGLHWLKGNLPAFGGDPQAITLLGHGTGAALSNILMVSPVSSDLIQHAVLVSGSALSPWAIQKNPLFVKRRVAEQTGCHGDMLYDDLAPCLRTKTAAELLLVKIDHPRFLVGFAPFIDGTVISSNTDSINKLSLPLGSAIVSTSGIEYANFPKRNLIFCVTSVESHLDLSAQDLEFGFNETRRDRILRTYVRNNFHYHLNEIFAVLKNEYTDWDKAIRSPLSSRDATLQFLSDGHTASPLIKLGYMHSLRGGRGYFLHFKHRTVEEEYPQRTGSVRGEDVPFWLGLPISPLFPHNYTTQEKQISRLMLRYLANFAKTGNPNQSSLSSPIPSSSSLISSPPSSSSSSSSSSMTSSSHATDDHQKVKRSPSNIVNATSLTSGPIKSNTIVVDVETAAAREALNLAVLYNQRRTKRTYYKRHSRSNDDHSDSSSSNEMGYFSNVNSNLDGDELPFWDAYDVVNQLYMELGNKAEIQSHYRGHKLSMWLNLIPQLHRHANMNDQSMRHHQFQDDLNNLNLYEGIVRAQIQTKPADDEDTLLLPKGRPTPPPVVQETNTTQKPSGGTTECGVDGAMFVAEMTTTSPSDNRSLVLDSREKEMATASTGIIGNLEVLRRLSGKQFQSYTTALVATVAVGCFLLVLNVLIFAGIYHQREKRARDAKTKEELQDNDTSKNSSMLKLNAMGSESGSYNGSGAGVSGKTTVVFGEYSCYDEKSLQTKDEKLMVELPPSQILEPNWASCSTSTLDLLKTKHHVPMEATFPHSNVVAVNAEQQTEHLMAVNAMEMVTYNPLPMGTGLIIDPSLASTSSGLLSKRGSFLGSSNQLNQYDFASVQSSDQMSFKDIENAVKVSVTRDDDITQDDDIPEPPPPPRSFQSMQRQQNLQQQQQQTQQSTTNPGAASSSGGGGGILRQAGTSSATQTGGGKKRVHIQEISV